MERYDVEAEEPAIRQLEHEDWIVRRKTAEALGEIGAKEAMKPLIRLLEDNAYNDSTAIIEEAIIMIGPTTSIIDYFHSNFF